MIEASPPASDVAALVARHRASELARVRTMLGAGQAGDGLRLMRVDAAAGLGSSALARVLADGWNDGPTLTLDARLRDGLGDHDANVALELRARSAAARVQALTARGRVLLVIDHAWEDELAATLYGALVDALDDDQDVSVLLLRRSDAGAASTAWPEIVAELAHRRPVPHVALGPLGSEAVEELVRLLQPNRSALERGRIATLAGGVPAVAAMLATSGRTVPETLREWVDVRLDGLDETCADALLTLALVDEGLLVSAIAIDPATLPFTVQQPSGAWAVEPPAVRHAILERASTARRRMLAAEAQQRLAGVDSPGAVADRARLQALRGDRAGSRELWTSLADEHERAGELERAVVARRHAIAMASGVEDRLDAVAAAARTIREQGLRSPSEEILLQLRRLATAAGDDELVAWSIRELAYVRQRLDALSDPMLAASDAGWAIDARANAAHAAGDYDEMARCAAAALERARQTGDVPLSLSARNRLFGAAAFVTPGSPHAMSAHDAAARLATLVTSAWTAGARHRALLAAASEGFVLRLACEFDRLVARMHEVAQLARSVGRPNHAATLEAYAVEGLTELARLDDAAELLARIEAQWNPAFDDGYVTGFLGLGALLLAVEVGVEDRIRDRHRALVDTGALDMHSSLGGVHELVLIREALELRDVDGAIRRIEQFVDADDDDLATACADAARCACIMGSERLADAARALRARIVERPGVPLVQLALDEADACLARDLARIRSARDAWRTHSCELRALRLEVVEASVDADIDEAALRELKARLRTAGMRGAEDRINARIRERGGRAVARARPRAGAPLSERERQVVGLAVEGLTNAQIAARLAIRPATVARILANVYRRHELRGRASLVRFLQSIE